MSQTAKLNKTIHAVLPWVVWGLGCLFYFYEFLLQVSPGVMADSLRIDFGIGANTLGMLAGVYFWSYAGMQIPAGLLLDKFGPHKLLTYATAICAVSTIAFGMTESIIMAAFARFCIGLGSAFAAVGTMKLAANWFKPQRFALLTGLMVAIGMTGAIGGEEPLAHYIAYVGWRDSMLYLGIAGVVIAALIHFIAKDQPEDSESAAPAISQSLIWGLKQALRNKQLWLVATYGGLVFMATPVLCGLWGVPYLTAKFSITSVMAASMVSLVFVGWIIGGPLWGMYSDRIQKRLPTMYIACIGGLISLCLVLYAPIANKTIVSALLFLFGLFSSAFLPAFSVAKEISNDDYCATSLSFMNMMNMVGVAIAQPFIGHALDYLWDGSFSGPGLRIYSVINYEVAISILPAGFIVALILLPFIKETHCQST